MTKRLIWDGERFDEIDSARAEILISQGVVQDPNGLAGHQFKRKKDLNVEQIKPKPAEYKHKELKAETK